MNLENELLKIIKSIDIINERAHNFLTGKMGSQYNDLRYSLWFQKELADDIENLNYNLSPINDALCYAEPTRKIVSLRDELEEKYEMMYDLFEKVSIKIKNDN